MDGMPGCPRLYFGVVDVRDVTDLHIRAMTHPSAKGERFIAVSGDSISMVDIARMLKSPPWCRRRKGATISVAGLDRKARRKARPISATASATAWQD